MSSKIPPPQKKKGVATGRSLRVLPAFCWGGVPRKQRRNPNNFIQGVTPNEAIPVSKPPQKKTPRGANLESSLESDVLGANHFWKYHFWYLFGMNIGMSHQKKSANNKKCCCNQWETKNVCRDPRGQRWFLGKWLYNS